MRQFDLDIPEYAGHRHFGRRSPSPVIRMANAGYRPRRSFRLSRHPHTKILVAAYVGALPVIAVFLMWIADPRGTAVLLASEMGKVLFYAGSIWVGIGMLVVRRMIFGRREHRGRSPIA